MGDEIVREPERDMRVHTAAFKLGSQQGHSVQHVELCSMSCGGLNERSLGENGYIHMCD